MPINFSVSAEDKALIHKIVDRAFDLIPKVDKPQVAISLAVCHANGCPLRLADLAEADDFNLIHDVSGIGNCISRSTGKIDGLFRPRFAV
jgi:hypothetical protein